MMLIGWVWPGGGDFLFGQNSPEPVDAARNSPATQPTGEQVVYTSGFQIRSGNHTEDLGLYAVGLLSKVRQQWYPQIPGLQTSTGRRQGITVIDFEVARDGSLGDMTTAESAGDPSFDNVALHAISLSAPFRPLPDAYQPKSLKLRMYFGYSQPGSVAAPFCDGPNWGAHRASYALHEMSEGLAPPKATFAPDPEYSDQARRAKYSSAVTIAGTVVRDGAFTDLCVTQSAGFGLDEKAMEIIKTWKFEPATLSGAPVAVRIQVECAFRLY